MTAAQKPHENSLRTQIDKRIQATRARNVDALLAHYAPETATFDLMEPLANVGASAVRKRASDWFASFESEFEYQIAAMDLTVDGELALDHHFTHVHGVNKGGKTIDMWFRETIGYRRVNGSWLITHQHSSVPLDMKTMQGRMDLTPQH